MVPDTGEAYLGAEGWDGCNFVPIKDSNSTSEVWGLEFPGVFGAEARAYFRLNSLVCDQKEVLRLVLG